MLRTEATATVGKTRVLTPSYVILLIILFSDEINQSPERFPGFSKASEHEVVRVSTLARLPSSLWLFCDAHGLLPEFQKPWVPSRQQDEISEGRFERKERKLCQFGSDAHPLGQGPP